MPDTPSTSKLFSALVRAQAHARAAERDGENKHHGYRYATAESLIQEGRTALTAAGLALIVTDVELEHRLITVPTENKETGEVTTRALLQPMLRATYVLAHESGESISYRREWPAVEQKGRPIDKAEGGALTTALGYAVRDVLCLPRDDQYADMDRRDDRGFDPAAKPAEQVQRPEQKPAQPQRLAESGADWDSLIADVRAGRAIRDKLDSSALSSEGRLAIAFCARGWQASDEAAFGKLGAEVRGSQDLTPAWRDIVMTEVREAWQAHKAKRAA